jgi:hypothetical protein
VLLGMYFIFLSFAYFMLWRSVTGRQRVKYELSNWVCLFVCLFRFLMFIRTRFIE